MPEPQLNVLLLGGQFQVRGTCAYTLRITEHLIRQGIGVQVICPDASRVPNQKRARLPIVEYRYLATPFLDRFMVELIRRDLLRTNLPDVIHVQSLGVLPQGIRIARRIQRPVVLTIHDFPPDHARLRLDRKILRKVIAVSQPLKANFLERTHVPDDFVTVIHSGVECSTEAETHRVLDPDHAPVVGTAGPLEVVKGLPYFLQAAQRVLEVRKDAEFLVAGAGPEERNLRRLAREFGITRQVTFAPNLFDFSVSLEALDIFCLPSLQQGLGTVMLEAMALGKPVIATGVGGVYSVVHDNETGFVVPPSDADRLAERILELLNDPLKARTIGARAREFVQQYFRVEEMVRRTRDVYHEVLDRDTH